MHWRLMVLGLLAVALAVATVICVRTSTQLMFDGQKIYTQSGSSAPTQKEQDAASRLLQAGYSLQLAITPLATGSLICALAIPAVLGRRWQLREADGTGQTACTRTINDAGST